MTETTTEKEEHPRLARWLAKEIERVGAPAIAEALGVHRTTVYAWARYARGERKRDVNNVRAPSIPVAKRLVVYAGGALQLRDIY